MVWKARHSKKQSSGSELGWESEISSDFRIGSMSNQGSVSGRRYVTRRGNKVYTGFDE